MASGAISSPVCTTLINSINILVASLTGFERILTTPIPTAYAVHLSQCIWLFCLFLPFQVLTIMKKNHDYLMILVVCITAFTMFGIVNIGEEIENPFGLDANDLPLTEYCAILRTEIESITRRAPPSIEDWVYEKPEFLQLPTPAHVTLSLTSTILG
ncbi:hypothetical protein DSO57_1031563 [Entomophthora muscae]|uniref:Uncharacterized protein n=1 Tax=Entomophthora muscae TaxID=34485 RepID=A0ACC2TBZ5_9FUNG|nr:hypothetical protein DSO57_1031563 [Entomophthora muscae]